MGKLGPLEALYDDDRNGVLDAFEQMEMEKDLFGLDENRAYAANEDDRDGGYDDDEDFDEGDEDFDEDFDEEDFE